MAAKFTAESFKAITFDDMFDFIEKNHPEDKAWFKTVAYQNKNGETVKKYNHLNAKRKFCEKYAPELIATKTKEAVSKKLSNW